MRPDNGCQSRRERKLSYPTQKPTCLVTGGTHGFLGQKLVEILLEQGYQVRSFDILPPTQPSSHPSLSHFQGDLRNIHDVVQACTGIDVVYHAASLILPRGILRQRDRKRLYDVNVEGTQNIINACRQCGVSKLVYTSSNNVVLNGAVAAGDESLPYATQFIDHYTRTKVLAEQAVLASNNTSGLLTCAIRPGGIYGPGDSVFIPKVLEACKRGLPIWRIGDGTALADHVYIDDLAAAHLLAADRLTPGSPVCGQAYFISDGCPANYFTFMQPVLKEFGYSISKRSLPYSIAYAAGYVCELIDYIKTPSQMLSRIGVLKLGGHNYFCIEKARTDLGYVPKISQAEGLNRSMPYCKKILDAIEIVDSPHIGWWLAVLLGMAILAMIAWGQDILALQALFAVSVLVHFSEALYAFKKASRAGYKTAKGWFVQTLLLGYPSLRLLLKKAKAVGL